MSRKKILSYCWESLDGKNWRKISFYSLFKSPAKKYAVSSALGRFFVVKSIEELEDLHFKLPTDPILTVEQKGKIIRKLETAVSVVSELEDLKILTYQEYADTKHGLFVAIQKVKDF